VSLFITFEGGEGSGKTSHTIKLTAGLQKRGVDFIITREPGGTSIGDAIRAILLDTDNTGMSAETELLLYLASRKQHLEEVIKPALKAGKLVLCDRYEDSTLAYQGFARGLGIDNAIELSRKAGIDRIADLTILFDIPPEIGVNRARGRSLDGVTRFENEELQFHRRVREGFLMLARREPKRFHILDTTKPPEAVEKEVLDIVLTALASG
jgi:dTMP kinase